MSRWISVVRPSVLPSRSRFLRGLVLEGSMLYSAVSQPRPRPAIHSGTLGSTIAVQSTVVPPAWRSTLPGAVLAVGSWIALSYGLGVYFRHFGNFNKTYGTLGTAIGLLVWLYWTNIVILFGAELNSELRKASGERPLPLKETPEQDLPKAA